MPPTLHAEADQVTVQADGHDLLRGRRVDTIEGVRLELSVPVGGKWVVRHDLRVPADRSGWVSFARDEEGHVYAAETLAASDAGSPADITLWRLDGDTLTPAVPPTAAPAPAPCPAGREVDDDPVRSARRLSVEVDRAAIRHVDTWTMSLSGAKAGVQDRVVQVEWKGSGRETTGDDAWTESRGRRASWIFVPTGASTWCALGPVAEGADETAYDGGPSSSTEFTTFAQVDGVVPGRGVLVTRSPSEGTGNGGSGSGVTYGLLRLDGLRLTSADLGFDRHGGASSGSWAELGAWSASSDAVLVSVEVVHDDVVTGHTLHATRFDGQGYVPWLSPLESSPAVQVP